MTDSPSNNSAARRRWISFGETIGLAAVAISALGLWHSWRTEQVEKPPLPHTEVKSAIPIAFRGRIEDEGKAMTIAPVEPGHALESLTLSVAGKPAITIGSDGRLAASEVQALVGEPGTDRKPGTLSVRFEARYIEAGTLKRGGGRYRISYRWDDGGLFGGDKLQFAGLSLG